MVLYRADDAQRQILRVQKFQAKLSNSSNPMSLNELKQGVGAMKGLADDLQMKAHVGFQVQYPTTLRDTVQLIR